jgi:hypothetical protein
VGLKEYKDPSALEIQYLGTKEVMLSETSRGDLFLREGAVCMRLEYDFDKFSNRVNGYCIVNLGTGRTWFADECAVKRVTGKLTVFDAK